MLIYYVTKSDFVDYIYEGVRKVSIEDIYQENYGIVYGFLLNITKNSFLGEELTALTFYMAIENIKQYDGTHRISSWLCQIAKNEFYKNHRLNKRFTSMDNLEALTIPGKSMEELLSDKELSIKIHTLIHKLNEPYKEVFNLRVFAELTFQEIGFILGKSENWARVTFYRAKVKILMEMEDVRNG